MSSLITINDTQIEQLTYHDQPVVTFEMIARVHGVPIKNVHKSFERHQERFTEGKHVHRLDFNEAHQLLLGVEVSPNGLRLFTQKGYLLLVKPMKDEQSWQVQERMIDEYFAMRQALQIQPSYIDAYPELKAISTLVLGLAEQRHELDIVKAENAHIVAEQSAQRDALIASQAQTIEALTTSQQAKSNTEIILDRYRMTLEQFVGAQGLIHIIPPATFGAAARWLGAYCMTQGWDAPQLPVQGRPWLTEKSYPVEALMRYVEYLGKRPQQIALVTRPRTGEATP